MRRSYLSAAFGALLVGLGVLLLLQNLNVLDIAWDLLWAFLFAVGGGAFIAVFVGNREQWWAVIPGFTLLGLAALSGLSAILPEAPGGWGGGLFLGMIGLAFWVLYLSRRENWWAVIPGGILITLALVAGFAETASDLATGGLFFFGLAATFGLLYLLSTPAGQMKWALIPAGILFVMGLLLLLASAEVWAYLWPLALILAGLYLAYRALASQQA